MVSNLGVFSSTVFFNRKLHGFTLIEVMVAIAVVAILSVVALPNMSNFLVKMRVDNEISEMQRLLLTARNMAINTGRNTTVCPLSSSGACTNNWQNEISVFTNNANTLANGVNFSASTTTTDADGNSNTVINDELIKVKEAINSGDRLQSTQTSVIYTPSGRLLTAAANFSYCPQGKDDSSRGIVVSVSGRSYTSSDTDNDDKDEDRNGNDIVCS